jgi:hypothetical protein
MFVEAIRAGSTAVNVIGLGTLAIGIVPLTIAWRRRSPYFDRSRRDLDTEVVTVEATDVGLPLAVDGS